MANLQLTLRARATGLTRSSGVTVSSHGQTIEYLDIYASGTGINVGGFDNVTIRYCRIYYNMAASGGAAYGIVASGADNLTVEYCEIINRGVPQRGAALSAQQPCIRLENGSNFVASHITTREGSSGMHLTGVTNTTVTFLENHDARGPLPRGQAVQWAGCLGTHLLEDASDESIPGTSKNEDNFSVYNTPNVTWRRLFAPFTSDSVSGRGMVVEQAGSTSFMLEDMQVFNVFNGGYCAAFDASASFTRVYGKNYNQFSVNGLAGSSNAGSTLGAYFIPSFPTTLTDGRIFGYPPTSPNGTNPYAKNILFNPDGAPVTVGVNLLETNWTQTVFPVRNAFPWRPTYFVPQMMLPVRIGSYWQTNPNTGANGVYGNTATAGTAILSVLPGMYQYDPTSLAWQWYRNGSPISGETGMNYLTVGGDAGATITVTETPANSAGTGAVQTSAGVLCA